MKRAVAIDIAKRGGSSIVELTMATDEKTLIPIDLPKSNFSKFIEKDQNKRLFFSGKFGIGKTYFLQKFFEEYKEDFDVYHLYPIRYEISSNENIIELLKYDLLVELSKLHPTAFSEKDELGLTGSLRAFLAFFKDKVTINSFLKVTLNSTEGLLSLSPDPFFQSLSKLGRPLNDLLIFDKEFQTFKKEYLAGEKGVIENYLKKIESTDPFATDFIDQLLREKILKFKGEKKSVLILDDFDRIDPEHIFRILNVMSAQMEGSDENKFGFDHIVIVGDIHNIESIFYHKYGEKTEFWGYFDKFFTIKPFYFDNKNAITERLPFLLRQIRYEDEGLTNALSEDGYIKSFLQEVLVRAFKCKEFSLRQLYKPTKYFFPEVEYSKRREFFDNSLTECINISIRLLIALYGNEENCVRVLTKIRNKTSLTDTENSWLFSLFTSSMLNQLILPLNNGDKFVWKKSYDLVVTDDSRSTKRKIIALAGDKEADARFFYDVLLSYIEEEKY